MLVAAAHRINDAVDSSEFQGFAFSEQHSLIVVKLEAAHDMALRKGNPILILPLVRKDHLDDHRFLAARLWLLRNRDHRNSYATGRPQFKDSKEVLVADDIERFARFAT